MNEKNLVCASYFDALSAVMDRLAARKPDLKKKHIVIVPDRVTLTAERMLCDRFGGSFDAFVTTWSRLFSKNVPQAGYLPRQGSVMIVRRILDEKKNELKCYSRSRSARGFAAKLYETISQLAVCDIPPDAVRLSAGNAKAEDIALVYREYLRRTEGMPADAAGRMRLLRDFLERSDYLCGATVYVACFDAYTRQMENILDVMRRKADEVTVFDTVPRDFRFGNTELYAASSPVFAAKAIAAKIACEVRNGVPYDEMCVVTAEERPDALARILGENGVPYTSPKALRLSEHPLGRFLMLALSVPVRGYRARDIVRLAKNPFSGVAKADADALERYVGAFGITYKLFLSPFTLRADAPEGTGERRIFDGAERARGAIASLIGLLDAEDAQTFAGLRRLTEYARRHYGEIFAADEGRSDPFDKAGALIDLCETLMRGADGRVILDALAEGMATTDLASRPRRKGVVEIGGERDFRARRFRHVFVADFNTDTHPATTSDGGLLSDDDIEQMRAAGTELSPTTGEVNRRARNEFFLLLAAAENVTLVHTEKAGASAEFIRSRAASFTVGGTEKDRSALASPVGLDDFLRLCPTKNMLIEEYLSSRERVESGFDVPFAYVCAEALVGAEAGKYEMPPDPAEVPEAGEAMLSANTKVSQIETYFACPMKHFLAYGLKLRPAETGELQAADVGNILHEVAEKYVAVMDEEDAERAALRLLGEALAATGKKDVEANRRMVGLLAAEATGMCRAIGEQIRAGSFRPVATELDFGMDGEPGVTLHAGGREITLRGRIDRVDVSGDFVRVIDYKTGSAEFSLTDLKCGVKIQLLVYLAVMMKKGYRPAGAFYFTTLSDFGDEHPYMPDGVCANDPEILTAMDADIAAARTSDVLNVRSSDPLVVGGGETEGDLAMLADYALRVSEKAAEEIMSGYIAPSPYMTSKRSACAACDYRQVCGYEGEFRKIRTASLKRGGKSET